MSKDKDVDLSSADTIVLDLGGYNAGTDFMIGGAGGAVGNSDYISGGGIDTITLDSSIYSINSSITSPSTLTWSQDYTNYSVTGGWNNDANVNISSDGISIKEGGDIKIGGRSLSEAIEKIEERLGILKPNPDLEDRWEQLKDLRKQYMELEKDLLEKEKIMKILKEK